METEPRTLTASDLAAQEALELPDREALSVIDPALVGGAGGLAAGASPYAADATQATAQPTADAAQQGGDYVSAATAHGATGAQPYQPQVTSQAGS